MRFSNSSPFKKQRVIDSLKICFLDYQANRLSSALKIPG